MFIWRSRLAGYVVAALAPIIVVALMCSITHLVQSPTSTVKRVFYEVIPTATIDTSPTAVGIADSDLYGMSDEDVAKTLDMMKSLGVTQVRVFVPWAFIELRQGSYFWGDIDKVVNAANDRGLAVLAAVTSTPTWASDSAAPNAAPRSPDDYANFVSVLAKRYGADENGGEAKIAAYEVWNEPNGSPGWFPSPDPAAYTELLKAAYTAIKKADPDALVVAAGLGAGFSAGSVTINPPDFLAAMYTAGAKGSFDAITYHPYQNEMQFSDGVDFPGSPYRQLIRMREVMDENGDTSKLIWTTEYGVPTSVVTEKEQAEFIADFLETWSSQPGVGPMFIYTTRDRQTGSTELQDTFGIFRTDWTRKEAANVIADWIAAHPSTVPPDEPTLIDWIRQAIAAVGEVIHRVIDAGVEVTKVLVNAFVSVVDWAVSTFVSGVKWVTSAIVDGVKWVVDTTRQVIDSLRRPEEPAAPAAVMLAAAKQNAVVSTMDVAAVDVPVAGISPTDTAAAAVVQPSQDTAVAEDATTPTPALAPESTPADDTTAAESTTAATDDVAMASDKDTKTAAEKPKAQKPRKYGTRPAGKPADKPGGGKYTHLGRTHRPVAIAATPSTDGAPGAGTAGGYDSGS